MEMERTNVLWESSGNPAVFFKEEIQGGEEGETNMGKRGKERKRERHEPRMKM